MVLAVTLEGPCDKVMQVQFTASVRGQLLSPTMGSVPQMVAKGDLKAEDATCKEIKVSRVWVVDGMLGEWVVLLIHGRQVLHWYCCRLAWAVWLRWWKRVV